MKIDALRVVSMKNNDIIDIWERGIEYKKDGNLTLGSQNLLIHAIEQLKKGYDVTLKSVIYPVY